MNLNAPKLTAQKISAPKISTPKISANRIVFSAAMFVGVTLAFSQLPADLGRVILPIVLVVVFVQAAIKAPPVAIALLLYYSMVLGGWFILAAAPGTMLLARRYQRKRLQVELNPDHIRRTALLGMAALVATLPFIGASLGAWSARSQASPTRSADPLIGAGTQPGEEGLLQRFARWLGFGQDGQQSGGFGPLEPTPVPTRPPPPDDPFNWWIIVAIAVILALLFLAWWLWRRRTPRLLPGRVAAPAHPLARLEAIGARVGRPRRQSEGAITYAKQLAVRTGDDRLADTGPLVSGQVYASAFANPGAVNASLTGIEAAPPPVPPRPPLSTRLLSWLHGLPVTARGMASVALVLAALGLALWLVLPHLGSL